MTESTIGRTPSGEAAAFLLCAVVTSAPIFIVAFNLGAYGEVFYEHLFALWAASIAAFLARLVIGRQPSETARSYWIGAAILLIPSVWMCDEVLLFGNMQAWAQVVRAVLTYASVCLALPYTLYVLALSVVPDLDRLSAPKLKLGLVGIWLFIALAGLVVGKKNDWFMTCRDFEIAGNTVPDTCWRGPS